MRIETLFGKKTYKYLYQVLWQFFIMEGYVTIKKTEFSKKPT